MKVAVIGYGKQGKRLADKFSELGVLYGVCDTEAEIPKGIKQTIDPAVFFDDIRVTAVVIATPTDTHYELAREALLQGKDVLIEKPMTYTVEEAEILEELASLDRILMVGHTTLYMKHLEHAKDAILSGVGKLEHLHFTRTNPGGWREGSSVVWRLMSHDIATVLGLLGKKKVEVVSAGVAECEGTDEAAVVRMKAGGIGVTCYASWVHPVRERYVIVVGDKGEIVLKEDGDDDPLMTECKHFVECCESRKQPVTDGKFGVRVVQVLEDIEEQL